MLLEIKNISKSYGKKKALEDISLTLEHGVYGLLGPNGAGKTTLIGIVTGLISPDSGSISYSDEASRCLGDALGYLPQYQSFYGSYTAEEMLMYMMCLKNYVPNDPKGYIGLLLEKVNLQDSRRKKIRTFSGGMKQRLGIAQTLIGDPGIIIYDEPTAGLDPKERIRFRNIVSSLGKDKIVILATHIVTDVAYIANKVIMINEGKLLYNAPQNEITESINGKVWQYRCAGEDIIDIMNSFRVSNVSAGENDFSVRIISDEKPFDTAVSVQPDLDDVCLYCFGEI